MKLPLFASLAGLTVGLALVLPALASSRSAGGESAGPKAQAQTADTTGPNDQAGSGDTTGPNDQAEPLEAADTSATGAIEQPEPTGTATASVDDPAGPDDQSGQQSGPDDQHGPDESGGAVG